MTPAYTSMSRPFSRREFLSGATAVLAVGCRTRGQRGPIVLRLSHSMATGTTSLHVFAEKFRELAEAATGGMASIRIFPSGTLGHEREVVHRVNRVNVWDRLDRADAPGYPNRPDHSARLWSYARPVLTAS